MLAESYGGPGTDGIAEIRRVFADLSRRPDTARHMARKLAVHFAADDPPPALVDALERRWRDTDGDLAQVYAVLVGASRTGDQFPRRRCASPSTISPRGCARWGWTPTRSRRGPARC